MVYAIIGGIVLILLISLFTSRTRVVNLYDKYSKVYNSSGINGKQLAFFAKQQMGFNELEFSLIDGKLTDCYIPKQKVLCLSQEVAETPSLASIAIVAHELGHAEQHFKKDPLFQLNTFFTKLTRITSGFILPCLLIGFLFYVFKWPTETIGVTLLITSAILFAIAVIVKLIIIPVEINASTRALNFLLKHNIITNKELPKVKKLLRTAGKTYIVALFDGILNPLKRLDKKIRG